MNRLTDCTDTDTSKKWCNTNSCNWWHVVQQITELQQVYRGAGWSGTAQRLHDGDVHKLADHIDSFFQQVAADVYLLSHPTMPSSANVASSSSSNLPLKESRARSVYTRLPDHMTCWTGSCVTSALSFRDRYVLFSVPRSEKALCLLDRKMPMWLRRPKPIHFNGLNTSASNLADCDSEQTARIIRWHGYWTGLKISWMDTRQYGALKGRSTTHALDDIMHHTMRLMKPSLSLQSSLTSPS